MPAGTKVAAAESGLRASARKKGMVTTRLSAKEREATAPGVAAESPEYPYGTRICLDNEMLERLGIDSLPEVGNSFAVSGIGEVISVSEHDGPDGKRRSVDIQLIRLAVTPE